MNRTENMKRNEMARRAYLETPTTWMKTTSWKVK